MINLRKIAFGGGCHWCTEAIFDHLKGVKKVEQGWVSSRDEVAREFSEAVIVHFEPEKISLDVLIEVHLCTHNATSNHVFRKKYRSAIYSFSKLQESECQKILEEKQKLFKKLFVTKVYSFGSFKLNEEQYLGYYKKNPQKPFCQVRIEPKLRVLLERFAEYLS